MIKTVLKDIYHILIGVLVVIALGGYINFLADRDSKMIDHYEQTQNDRY